MPASVMFYNKDMLPNGAKLLYTYILALSRDKGYCFASNTHFAKKFNCSDRTLNRYFTRLIDLDFISVEKNPKDNRSRIIKPLRFTN